MYCAGKGHLFLTSLADLISMIQREDVTHDPKKSKKTSLERLSTNQVRQAGSSISRKREGNNAGTLWMVFTLQGTFSQGILYQPINLTWFWITDLAETSPVVLTRCIMCSMVSLDACVHIFQGACAIRTLKSWCCRFGREGIGVLKDRTREG